jgi:hypothetical protein
MTFPEKIDFAGLMEPVALRLLGKPNPRKSKPPHDVRFGTRGSMSVNYEKGCFTCYETGIKGGVLDLIEYKLGATVTAPSRGFARRALSRIQHRRNRSHTKTSRRSSRNTTTPMRLPRCFSRLFGMSQRISASEGATMMAHLSGASPLATTCGSDQVTIGSSLMRSGLPISAPKGNDGHLMNVRARSIACRMSSPPLPLGRPYT